MEKKNGWDLSCVTTSPNLSKLFNPPLQGQCPHYDTKYSLPDVAEGEAFVCKLQSSLLEVR